MFSYKSKSNNQAFKLTKCILDIQPTYDRSRHLAHGFKAGQKVKVKPKRAPPPLHPNYLSINS